VLAGVQVEHELRECAMQMGELAAQHGEARAGELCACFAIEPAVAFAEDDVVLYFEIEVARGAPAGDFGVVVFVLADGDGFVRDVGYAQGDGGELSLHVVQGGLVGLELVADTGDFGHEWRDVFALGLGLADGLGTGVAQVLQFLRLGGQLLAFGFQRLDGGHVQGVAAGVLQARGGFGQARTQ